MVITGAGVVSSIGTGLDSFWDALAAGSSGARLVDVPEVGAVTACPVNGDDAVERFGRRAAHRMDRVGRLAAIAAAEAIERAGEHGVESERIGAVVANIHGGADTMYAASVALLQRGLDRVSPLVVPLGLPNSAVAAVTRVHGLRGPSSVVTTACAAGSDAIGLAVLLIRAGRADAMLAGGAEAAVSSFVVAGYRRLGALSTSGRPASEASRPFDRARDGFVMGEGAGILFLEERDRAIARGARILAEVLGYGSSCDAGHLTDPDPTGAGPARAIRIALDDARLDPRLVGHVNAHATSTPAGDAAEARAIDAAGLAGAAVSATKSLHGHTLGAAGGIEAIAAIMPFVRGVIPATANLVDPVADPALDHVRSTRRATVDVVLSNSFGFGGHNAALLFGRGG